MSPHHKPRHLNDDDETSATGDTQSDPALDDGPAADWSSEGGAVPEGPATDADD